jgi:hypothetical protein
MCLCSYIADTSPEVEDAAVKRGLPLGADSSRNLYFYLGSEAGALHLLPNHDHEVADAKSAWSKFPSKITDLPNLNGDSQHWNAL